MSERTQGIFLTKAIRPYVLVQTNPQTINLGQPITVSARLYDKDTNQPQIVSRIFMTIISLKDGHKIWNSEVVNKNDWKFDILIGTGDMKEGHKYEIRVSNNWNFSPMGATEFKIVKDATIPIILLPFVIPISKQREFIQKEITKFDEDSDIRNQLEDKLDEIKELREPIDDITKKKVKYYIFRTEMDKRVCAKYCKPLENKVYDANERLPDIPLHPKCRCVMEIVYFDQFNASFTEVLEILHAAKTAHTVNDTLKVIDVIEATA